MSAFGLDPGDSAPLRRRPKPRVVRGEPPRRRGRGRRRWYVLVGVFALIVVAWILLGLRARYLYYASMGQTAVFWTPFVAQLVLFLGGFALGSVLVGVHIPGWVAAARHLDRLGAPIARRAGLALTLLVGLISGLVAAGGWQDVLLWLHGQRFGVTDPVFGLDVSFFVFTLPLVDALQGFAWAGVIIGAIGALGLAVTIVSVANAPAQAALPLTPPPGRSFQSGLRAAIIHCGICLAAILVLAALGAYVGAFHLAYGAHQAPDLVGLDATDRAVVRPVLGGLVVVALLFAAATVGFLIRRRSRSPAATGGILGALFAGWLLCAGIAQWIPAAVYRAASVTPNALSAQTPAITDYLAASRQAWAIQAGSDVEVRPFVHPTAPTLTDLQADAATVRNIRIQDYRQLPDVLNQIERSRSYQTFPRITVDRYPAGATETEVMLAPREISEGNLPNTGFVNRALVYTHGYGISAASVTGIGNEGRPQLLAGGEPLAAASSDAPPDLTFAGDPAADPRIYCGFDTTQPVVVNTTQGEFDYPSGTSYASSHAGSDMVGIPVNNTVDRLAVSLNDFGSLDLLLTGSLTADSRVMVNRAVTDRINSLAPFLRLDGDPYVVADRSSHHLLYVTDAYVTTDRYPEAFQQSDGTSYMRNSVKVVIDAKTCKTTLYVLDAQEPIIAAWRSIYPSLFTPFEEMPASLRAHLRYPEDLFTAQASAYAAVHVANASAYFNNSDRYRLAEEFIGGVAQPTQAYYVEVALPNESRPRFVLFQAFSPASGSGAAANNMTAWLAAVCDYTSSAHPHLVAVPLSNAADVLGPLQFDNNINTNPDISKEVTLLNQNGSRVTMGNVIVLPINNDSFLYVRPLYVSAVNSSGTSFPQLQRVLVGSATAVAEGNSLAEALQHLLGTSQPIPGLASGTSSPTVSPGPSPSPGQASPSASPSAGTPATLTAAESRLLTDLLQHQQSAETALRQGDFATYGTEEAAVKRDADQLRQLLATPAGP